MEGKKSTLKDGYYRCVGASYWIRNGEILAKIHGHWCKTNANFVLGEYKRPLTADEDKSFEAAYSHAKNW